jgi:transcriptional regulator with XRE-family HTH domain
MDAATVGERIRRLRRAQGLNQQDLAGPGVSASYVSLLEAGRRRPSPSALAWLAGRLGTTVEDLAGMSAAEVELELRHAELELGNGDAAHALARFQRFASDPDPSIAWRAESGAAACFEVLGDLEQAIAGYERLWEKALAASATVPLLRTSIALSRCCREVGDLSRAVDVGERGLRAAQDWGLSDTDAEVDLLCTVAIAYQERGDVVRASQLLSRVRAAADALGSPRARGAVYWNASVLAGELGAMSDAVELAGRALALFGEGDDTRNLARLRNAYATLLMRNNPERAPEALDALNAARAALASYGSAVDLAYCDTEIARALVLLGRPTDGLASATAALETLGTVAPLEAARARLSLAFALAALGHGDEAASEYTSAAEALERLGAPRQAAQAWSELSEHLAHAGAPADALRAAKRALLAMQVMAPFSPASFVRTSKAGAPVDVALPAG